MPGISSMLPKGGNAIWGNLTWAPDDVSGQDETFGSTLKFAHKNGTMGPQNMTVSESLQFLFSTSSDWYKNQVTSNYSHGVALSRKEIERNERIPNKWVNPLESRLPLAPNMKIYCFYGEYAWTPVARFLIMRRCWEADRTELLHPPGR
jgi:phospholipid:diacylglycerol acyltransferase